MLHRALEIDDKSKAAADTWNNLGLVALARRRDQEAFAHFDQATKLDPGLTVARRNKAAVYLDCGDYARAAEELKHLTRSDETDIDAWVALGVAERGQANLEGAARAFEKALEVDPNAADALYDFAVLEMDFKKEPARARTRLESFLKAAPSGHPKRADAEARMKELDRAVAKPAPRVHPEIANANANVNAKRTRTRTKDGGVIMKRVCGLVVALVLVSAASGRADKKPKPAPSPPPAESTASGEAKPAGKGSKTYTFTGLDIDGKLEDPPAALLPEPHEERVRHHRARQA